MRSPLTRLCAIALPLVLAAGCQSAWEQMEPVADSLIPPTNAWSSDSCKKELADRVGEPCDVGPFADRALYMGDQDDYRYVHLRDLFDECTCFGEQVVRIPKSQWPMANPMPLTTDAAKWVDVAWMGGDGPEGVAQSPFLHATPTFPLGAPASAPARIPVVPIDPSTRPMPAAATEPLDSNTVTPITQPATQP